VISAGNTTWGGGGIYEWEINDATGTAGADLGWDLLTVTGNLDITASSGNKFTVKVTTLRPDNTAGPMANFNPGTDYEWVIAATSGGITGFVTGKFLLDTAGVANALSGRTFNLVEEGNVLVLTLAKPLPTAAVLAYFDAAAAGVGKVRLIWGTCVEYDVLGFHVDRSAKKGDWERVTKRVVPATGANQEPQRYSMTDEDVPEAAELYYRLVGVDLAGQERVLAEATVRAVMTTSIVHNAGRLSLNLRGTPNLDVTVETAVAVAGPWTPAQTLTLDEGGTGTVSLSRHDECARFYRVVSD